jgi:hypothetical protein
VDHMTDALAMLCCNVWHTHKRITTQLNSREGGQDSTY